MLYMANLRGQHVHAVQADELALQRRLRASGYEVYRVDASRIVDERTFQEEVTRALGLPEWGADGGDARPWTPIPWRGGQHMQVDRLVAEHYKKHWEASWPAEQRGQRQSHERPG